MVQNFPGPYEIEFTYTVADFAHKQRLNVNVVAEPTPGADPATIELVTRSGGTINLAVAVAQWVGFVVERFSSADAVWNDYIFYKYTPLTFDRQFITTASLNEPGTRVEATNLASQEQYTFRSQEGGVLRINLLDTVHTRTDVEPTGAAAGTNAAIIDYVLDPNTWILARDTSFPIAGINVSYGQNEAVFKRRFRS